MKNDNGAMLTLLLMGAAVYWLANSFCQSDYITVYRQICFPEGGSTEKLVTFYECSKSGSGQVYMNSMRFRVDYLNQRVFEMTVLGAERWDNCAVADSRNWTCRRPNATKAMIMADGEYSPPDWIPSDQLSWPVYTVLKWMQ